MESVLDELIFCGYVEVTTNEDGECVYRLTKLGEDVLLDD